MPYLIICGLVITGLSQLSTNKNFTGALAMTTTVKPETLTELYFSNHLELPSIIKNDQAISFEFTTHNLEYTDFDYIYEVYIEKSGERTVVQAGQFTLKHDESRTISVSYTPTETLEEAKIIVDLVNKNQQIYFWIKGGNENVR